MVNHIKKTSISKTFDFYYVIIAVILFSTLTLSLWFDQSSGVIRVFVAALIFFITFIRVKLGALITIVTVGWWEVPTLHLGLPNQFICEALLIGFSFGSLREMIPTRVERFKLSLHPLFFPLVFLSTFIFVQWGVSLFELYQFSYEGISWIKLVKMIGSHIWYWDIEENPVHTLSIMQAYLIQVFFLYSICALIEREKLKIEDIIKYLLVGSWLIAAYALLQTPFFSLIPIRFSPDIGSTFQNGNHLSYYSGLIILVSFFGLTKAYQRTMFQWICGISCILALFTLIIGEGRTAWIAMILCSLCAWLVHIVTFIKLKDFKKILWNLAGIVGLVVFLLHIEFSQFSSIIDIVTLLKSGSISEILTAGGRSSHIAIAWHATSANPLNGLGVGLFVRKVASDFEIHSIPLWLVVSFGWIAGLSVVALFMATAIKSILRNENLQQIHTWNALAIISILIYIILCALPDNYFSYRSLLTVSSLALFISLPSKIWINRNYLPYVLLIAVGCGLLSIMSPISTPIASQTFRYEPNAQTRLGESRWNGPFLYWEIQPKTCIALQIYPIFPRQVTEVYFGVIPNETFINSFHNLSDHIKIAINHAKGNKIFKNAHWQNSCMCNKTNFDANHKAFIMSKKGEYLSLSKHDYGPDNRFITFGTTPPEVFNYEFESEKLASLCDYVFEF